MDIETRTFGRPDPDKDIMRIFGCYSYKTNKTYLLTNPAEIQKIINAHKYLVGFNNKYYDNPVLKRHNIKLDYKIIIDLMEIFKKRVSGMKIKKGFLINLLMRYSLDFITKTLDLVDEDTGKKEIDYSMFRKETWTEEETKEISEYTKRDIDVTKKLYEWVEDYFSSFKDFVTEKDLEKKSYLTCSLATFAYKSICRSMKWPEEYSDRNDPDEERISGGYVAYPAGEKFKGNIYCLDFACLPTGTKIRRTGKNGCDGHYHSKLIENIKPGDTILNQDGEQIVGAVSKRKYNGELICIELENGKKVKCTPEHKFPIIRDNKECVIEAKDLKETDEMITTQTKRNKKNPNYKVGKILIICEVCGTEFTKFPSEVVKGCSNECSNILKSINNSKPNLGKTKYNTDRLMKMSVERKGIKRNKKIKNNISVGTKKAMKNIDMSKINKNRDMSFMKTIEWKIKVAQSRSKNIKNGKWNYKGINFRSNWERMVAKNMDKNKIKWVYEPKIFKLDDDTFYLPDFYLPDFDKYLEVKGYMYDHSRVKINKFIKQHDNLILLNDLNKVEDGEVMWLK